MDVELIRKWLALPEGHWPPDHYTLLGLSPGEPNVARIEHEAHERMCRVRRYQLSHPGLATAVMNRLADAYACLTDPRTKRAYDTATFPNLPASPPSVPEPAVAAVAVIAGPAALPSAAALAASDMETLVGVRQTQLDWRDSAPPPIRVLGTGTETPFPGSLAPLEAPPPAPGAAPPQSSQSLSSSGVILVARPADPVFDAARSSPEARRGLGTRRGLYERVVITRKLLRLWERAGRYIGKAGRKLSGTAAERELVRVLTGIEEELHNFPPLLGEPGKPGYRIVVLATEENVPAAFAAMDVSERDALARDWQAGQALLQAHLTFLRKELDQLRCCSRFGLLSRAVCAAVHDHPGWVYAFVIAILGGAAAVLFLS